MRALLRTTSVFLFLATPLAAQFGGSGEFQVNTYTTGYQSRPSVASDADGDFLVVWEGCNGQDGQGCGIFGQRYTRTGAAAGSEFQVNTYTTEYQTDPRAAVDADGDFVVAWEECAYDRDGSQCGVFAQRFGSDGVSRGTEFQVNSYTTYTQIDPAVASAAGGDFVVVWSSCSDQDGYSCGIFGQRFASDGSAQGTELQVNTFTSGTQRSPSVAVGGSGGFVVAWTNYGYFPVDGDGDNAAVFARRFDSSGAGVGGDFQVNTYTTGDQGYPDVAVESDGDFVLAWMNGGIGSNNHDGDGHGIFAQLYRSDGSAWGAEFQVNSYTIDDQRYPSVDVNADGSFVVAWESDRQDDGNYGGVFAQRFAEGGVPTGTEFQVNTYTTYRQRRVSVASVDGQFVVAWQSAYQDPDGAGIFATSFELCPALPLTGCKAAGKNGLKIKNDTTDTKDKFLWKWIKGDATGKSEFGSPVTGTMQAVCIYGNGALVGTARIPGGGTCGGNPCWKDLTSGFKYKDKQATNDGVFKMLFKASTDPKAKVLVKGKGANLPDLLPLTLPVTVQLVNGATGDCWSSTFTTADTNDAAQFKAKAP